MYARVLAGARAAQPRAIQLVVAGLRCEPGFSGALSLVHAANGDALLLVFWETEAQAARSDVSGFDTERSEVWEVAGRA